MLEASYRLNIPRLFAALLLLSLTGIAIFLVFTLARLAAAASLARERRAAGELRRSGRGRSEALQQEVDGGSHLVVSLAQGCDDLTELRGGHGAHDLGP